MRLVLALLAPTLAWLAGVVLAAPRAMPPHLAAAAGTVAAPAVLRWLERPVAEQAVAWGLGVVAWGGLLIGHDPGIFIALAIVSGSLCLALSARTGGHRDRTLAGGESETAAGASPTATPPLPPPPPQPDAESDVGEIGFRLSLRCPNCGGDVPVAVHHHMVRCPFCGSQHLMLRHEDVLVAVVPDAVTGEAELRQAVAAHLGHLRYMKLYDQRVRPLVEQHERSLDTDLAAIADVAVSPVIAAVEASVKADADAWAARAAERLRVRRWDRFLSPYWHRLGTLYQAAFGRDRDGAKRLEFAITTLEASIPASSAPLPEMGKLSYLRALRPLAGSPEAALAALDTDHPLAELEDRMRRLSQRSAELTLDPIARHATLVPEVTALVYRPWHLVEVDVDGESGAFLVDGGAASVSGNAPTLDLPSHPAAQPPCQPVTLMASRCPDCGAALEFAADAVAHLCRNCWRLVVVRAAALHPLPYLVERRKAADWSMPFWRFPLQLRRTDGTVVTDIAHVTDGIDGTLDQIGDSPMRRQSLFVPAFRTRSGKTGAALFRRLWPLLFGQDHDLGAERFTVAEPPRTAVDVTLPAEEARVFASVYLALAFTQRDLARAQVQSVRAGFLGATLEGSPELAFLAVPEALVAPCAAALGRPVPAAIADLSASLVRARRQA